MSSPSYLTLLALLFFAGPLIAQTVPQGMTYQGRLSDASNAPVPDGTGYEIEVRLWNASTGGNLLWGTRYSGVALKHGAFNLILGSGGIPIPGAASADLKTTFNTPSVYLAITPTKSATGTAVPSPTEILPRQQIFSTPFALKAETASAIQNDGVVSSSIKDGEVKAADISDAAVSASKLPAAVIDNSKIAPKTITPDRLSPTVAVFCQMQDTGSPPQAAMRGWQKRELNTSEMTVGSGITLDDSTDRIALTTGVYEIHASVPYLSQAVATGIGSRHRGAIRRVSDSELLAVSPVSVAEGEAANTYTRFFRGGCIALDAIIVVGPGGDSIELAHHIQDTVGGGKSVGGTPVGADGSPAERGYCGAPSPGSGLPEIYSRISIKRLQ